MATKKHKKKKGSTPGKKKHHVGAVDTMGDFALAGLGALAGGVASAFVVNMFDTAANGKVPLVVTRGLVTLAAVGGAYAGRKHPIALGAGLGAAAGAGAMTLNELGVNIPGLSGLVSVGATRHRKHRVNGMTSVGEVDNEPPMASLATRELRAVGALYSN